MTIDLNADVGEGLPGTDDLALLGHVTSANVACGGHAGDVETMRATVRAALARDVAVGAHPSFPDHEHFGRREMTISASALATSLSDQLNALATIADEFGLALRHVKPHGALYNMAARDRELASIVVRAVRDFDARLTVVGLAGSVLLEVARDAGLQTAGEGFADRAYQADGTLVPRGLPGAVITDARLVVQRAVEMVTSGSVESATGVRVSLRLDTLCVHGDTPGAATLAEALRRGFALAGVQVTHRLGRRDGR